MADGLCRIHITGFRSLADVTLEPGRLTVLIGENGAGKSNLLGALKMVPLMRTQSLQNFVGDEGGAAALLHYGPKRTQTIVVELDFLQDDRRYSYRAQLGFAAGDRLVYLGEAADYEPGDDEGHTLDLDVRHWRSQQDPLWESQLKDAKEHHETARIVNHLISRLTFFHFHDTSTKSPLRTHARAVDDRDPRSDGSNLAAYLARLEQSGEEDDRKAWRRINQFVRRIAPAVKELCPARVGRDSVRLDWIDDRDERFGVHQLSDGTLRAIALITVFAQPADKLPRFICIDEPELGLHPAAIALIADLARSVSRHTQVLFATQSTAFLDHFEPNEVVVVEREAGASVLTRHDANSLQGWLEDYSLSEVFDKGVIGGRP